MPPPPMGGAAVYRFSYGPRLVPSGRWGASLGALFWRWLRECWFKGFTPYVAFLGPLGASLRALRGGPWSASRSWRPFPSHTAHGGRGAVLPVLARFAMSGASLRAPAVWSAAPVPTGGGLSELAASLEPSARPQRPHRRYSLPRYVGAVPRVRSRSETRGAIGSCAAVRADCQRSGATMPPAGHQPDAQRGACPAKGMPRCGSA